MLIAHHRTTCHSFDWNMDALLSQSETLSSGRTLMDGALFRRHIPGRFLFSDDTFSRRDPLRNMAVAPDPMTRLSCFQRQWICMMMVEVPSDRETVWRRSNSDCRGSTRKIRVSICGINHYQHSTNCGRKTSLVSRLIPERFRANLFG